MFGKSLIDIVTIIIALGAATAINRSNVKKHTIKDLQALVDVHEKTIKALKAESVEKDKRIRALEDTIDEYAELVRGRHSTGIDRQSSGDGSASTEAAENGSVR